MVTIWHNANLSGPPNAEFSLLDDEVTQLSGTMPTPLYHQVYLVLRDKILSGQWESGDRVPSEAELATAFEVSRITVRRAVQELADEGLVERRRGSGTRVGKVAARDAVRADLANILPYLEELGRRTGSTVLAFAYVVPPPDVARDLGLAPGATAQRAVRVRTLDAGPFSHLTTYVPADIGSRFGADDLASTPLLRLLDRAGHRPTRARQTITAGLADPDLSQTLDLPVGSAVMTMTRLVFDQNGRPIEWICGHYRPDRFHFALDLERIEDDEQIGWMPQLALPIG